MSENHCCKTMEEHVNYKCKSHKDKFKCPDALVWYEKKYDEYGLIIHDGGHSVIGINYCPWCGTKLPESKRDQWFDTLEQMGFDDPVMQNIPEEFKTGEWYMKRGL